MYIGQKVLVFEQAPFNNHGMLNMHFCDKKSEDEHFTSSNIKHLNPGDKIPSNMNMEEIIYIEINDESLKLPICHLLIFTTERFGSRYNDTFRFPCIVPF